MSHLGKKPIPIPVDVSVSLTDNVLHFAGKKGELDQPVLPFLKVAIADQKIIVKPIVENKQADANWGTMAALVKNALQDVKEGFSKSLIVEGIGYRVDVKDQKLVFHVGFSHPVERQIPNEITVEVKKNHVRLSGVNRQLVGQVAAEIRNIKKPEPYKGKGIRYENEVIRRKAGKKAVTGA